jgi:hypothetical protein
LGQGAESVFINRFFGFGFGFLPTAKNWIFEHAVFVVRFVYLGTVLGLSDYQIRGQNYARKARGAEEKRRKEKIFIAL